MSWASSLLLGWLAGLLQPGEIPQCVAKNKTPPSELIHRPIGRKIPQNRSELCMGFCFRKGVFPHFGGGGGDMQKILDFGTLGRLGWEF